MMGDVAGTAERHQVVEVVVTLVVVQVMRVKDSMLPADLTAVVISLEDEQASWEVVIRVARPASSRSCLIAMGQSSPISDASPMLRGKRDSPLEFTHPRP
jgi:hypothetical protein